MLTDNTFSSHHRRGSVMILVVAVLGLLAVIGTVYIVSSRADRASANAASTNVNGDLALAAVMNRVQQVIGNGMTDAGGTPGGFQTSPATYGALAARNFDIPETNGTIGHTAYNASVRDEPWLASNLNNTSGTDYSTIDSLGFDPLNGTYDIPLVGAYTYNFGAKVGTTVVGDFFPASLTGTLTDNGSMASDSYMYLLPFSDATGVRYRYGIRIIDTNRMANLNIGAPADNNGGVNFPDAFGQYITSYGLAPSGAVGTQATTMFTTLKAISPTAPADVAANLHTGSGTVQGRRGASPAAFSLPGWQSLMMKIERPYDTTGTLSLFDLGDEMELRAYGNKGTYYHPRFTAASAAANNFVWINTLGNGPGGSLTIQGNSRRASYTTYSFSREMRPYADPPTAGADQQFTLTYSSPAFTPTNFSKDFTTASVVAGTPAHVWPSVSVSAPASANPRVAINSAISPDISPGQSLAAPSQQNWDSMYLLAMNATNIATAMEHIAGFRRDEACAFAANYLTSMWGYVQDPAIAAQAAYYLPGGPSIVDANGICIRTAVNASGTITPIGANFSSASDLNTTEAAPPAAPTSPTAFPADTMIGYAAQPFIYRIAIQSTSNGSAVAVTDFVVELYNPYTAALSMNGYHLVDPTTGMNLTLTQDDFGQNLYVPPKGFLIITTDGTTAVPSALAPPSSASIVVAKYNTHLPAPAANYGISAAGSTISIQRPFYDRAGTSQLATVDRSTYLGGIAPAGMFADPATASAGGTSTEAMIARLDLTNSQTMGTPVSPIPAGTLAVVAAPTYTYLPYDRSISAGAGIATSPSPIVNIADFNHIMRIGNVTNATGTPVPAAAGTPSGLLTDRFNTLGTAPDTTPNAPAAGTGQIQQQKEGILYFDFWPDPTLYANPAYYPLAINPATGTPCPTVPNCDFRAITLLNCLATIDRFSDFSIDIGNSNPDINKLRIPGKVNINTASGDVLRAIPNMTDQMVADILYYRSGVPKVYGTAAAPSAGVLAYAATAGRGFHDMAEVLVPLGAGSATATIDLRDRAWASVYNLCTVSSDTFVVYGYLEAIRIHPNATALHDNQYNWYDESGANTPFSVSSANDVATTDDPHAVLGSGPGQYPNLRNLRVARRRWVAIIDRSWSNTTQSITPRIVAIKDLPQ